MSIVCTFILQFYLNTLFMNKVGECIVPGNNSASFWMKKVCIILDKNWKLKNINVLNTAVIHYDILTLESVVTVVKNRKVVSFFSSQALDK